MNKNVAFAKWLEDQIKGRKWTRSELARRAGVSSAAISDVMNQNRNPGVELCSGIARAFSLPPEEVLRRAGLLPDTGEPDDLLTRIIANIADKLEEGRREELRSYAEYQLRMQEQKGEYLVNGQNHQEVEATS